MTITSLSIDSYKSIIRPLRLTLSPQINIFIGQNNSGKTNIIDAIDFVFNPDKFPSRLHHHRARIAIQLEDRRELLTARGYEVSGLTADLRGKVKRLSADEPWDFGSISQDYQRLFKLYPQQYQVLNEIFSSYFPHVAGDDRVIDLDWQAGHAFIHEDDKPLVLERLGSGFQKIFIILLYAFHPDYPIILLDEPETHLHPALIKKLAKVLASKSTNQVILTTHSPLFIQTPWLSTINRVVRSWDEGTVVYHLDHTHRGLDPARLAQELNADNLEMFFADKVLMVEGASDRLLLRGLIDRFYHGPLEVKVIEAHGKGNMELYRDLLEAFHIPSIIMLDLDALSVWQAADRHWRQDPARLKLALQELRQRGIYILPNGTIEHNYPRRYQKSDRKTLNALRAAAQISLSEYQSGEMANLRQVIEAL
ncbi:MAG: AAA family ATPase [Candidatus Komeilibacteria bacterium]